MTTSSEWGSAHNIVLIDEVPDDFPSAEFPSDVILNEIQDSFKYPEFVVDPRVSGS